MKQKKMKGIEALNRKYGRIFVSPWVLGMILFYIVPLFQSIIFAVCNVSIRPGGIDLEWEGFGTIYYLIFEHNGYTDWYNEAFISFAYSLPVIILLSMVLALILNQKFRGRLFFRALYFLPVIISTGAVIGLLFQTTGSDLSSIGVSEGYSESMFSVDDIVKWLGLQGEIAKYISTVISKIFDLIWSCGIQTVLFIAGLQSVPSTLYEASRVEGATKWEEFWFITFPMLARVTLLVAVFTMVELIVSTDLQIVNFVYGQMRAGIYDQSSAMLWAYFLVSGGIMGIMIFLFNYFCMRRWE